jgi:hypothetical protein
MRTAVVFHRGALGDSVLTWPLLASLATRHEEVAFITDVSKGRLAQRFADPRVLAIDAERPEFTSLWTGKPPTIPPIDADVVIHLCATPADADGQAALDRWTSAARLMYPGARIITGAGVLHRGRALELARTFGRAVHTAARAVTRGPIVMHIGAGSSEKRWPLPLWRGLMGQVQALLPDRPIRLIAGEVESDRLTAAERTMFMSLGGRFLFTLDELADVLDSAGAYIGADSGPTHVAGAIGLPTIALFGPTDPELWAPIGPRVHVLAPPAPKGMAWLTPPEVAARVAALLTGTTGP